MGSCSWNNLGSCITNYFFEFISDGLSLGIQPFIDVVKKLITVQPNTELFTTTYVAIIYMLSLFYGLLLIYTGFQFITSGYDIEKRENAKEWFKNIIVMIVLVQSSYFFYTAALELTSIMTNIFYNMIDPNFFLMSSHNLSGLMMQIICYMSYILILLLSIILLSIRYVLASVGVVLFPIGIFLYFIPPVKAYGSMIVSYLFSNMFITIPITIMFKAFSVLINQPIIDSFKALFQITSFMLMIYMIYSFSFFSMMKSIVQKPIGLGKTVVKSVIMKKVIPK